MTLKQGPLAEVFSDFAAHPLRPPIPAHTVLNREQKTRRLSKRKKGKEAGGQKFKEGKEKESQQSGSGGECLDLNI